MEITKHEHVVPREKERWAVKVADGERASKVFENRKDAIEYAKELAKKHNVCMVVHDESGKFKDFKCGDEIKIATMADETDYMEESKNMNETEKMEKKKDSDMMNDEMEPGMMESEMMADDMAGMKPKNHQVIMKDNKWAVVTNGDEVIRTFKNKGYAMLYAYRKSLEDNSCMLTETEEGKFEGVVCPPDQTPGIIEVIRMNLRV